MKSAKEILEEIDRRFENYFSWCQEYLNKDPASYIGTKYSGKAEMLSDLKQWILSEPEKKECEHEFLIKADEFFTGIPKCRLCGHEHIRYKSDALIKAEKWLLGDTK